MKLLPWPPFSVFEMQLGFVVTSKDVLCILRLSALLHARQQELLPLWLRNGRCQANLRIAQLLTVPMIRFMHVHNMHEFPDHHLHWQVASEASCSRRMQYLGRQEQEVIVHADCLSFMLLFLCCWVQAE